MNPRSGCHSERSEESRSVHSFAHSILHQISDPPRGRARFLAALGMTFAHGWQKRRGPRNCFPLPILALFAIKEQGMKITKKAGALSLSLLLSLLPGASLLAHRSQGKGWCASSSCCCCKNCPMRSAHSPMPERCPMSKARHSPSMTTCTCSVSQHPPASGLATPVRLIFDLPGSGEPGKLDSSPYRQVGESPAREDAFIPPPDQPPRTRLAPISQ